MPKLVIEKGADKGRSYRVSGSGTLILGRDTTAHIRVLDNLVSRHHFHIRIEDGRYLLSDLGSANGTYLNGNRLEGEQPLKIGDRVQAGETILSFLDDAVENKPDTLIGQVINGYRIEERVGRGGMGTVYRATQMSLNRTIAFKILAEDLTKDIVFITRFINEARSAGELNHPHLIQAHDVGRAGDVYYFSMEYAPGGSLQDVLSRERKFPAERAIAVITDVARGLEYAEKKGIVHRDIKPDNLMFGEDGLVKIGDLGISKKLSAGEVATADSVMGSPHYMAPEQARGEPVDNRSDLYSLGVTFYRMLAGRTPFTGSSPREIMEKHVREAPPPLKELAPGTPMEVVRIVNRLMAKNPADRHLNATELLKDLEGLGRPRTRATGTATSAAPKSNPIVAITVAAAVVLLFIVLATISRKPPDDRPPTTTPRDVFTPVRTPLDSPPPETVIAELRRDLAKAEKDPAAIPPLKQKLAKFQQDYPGTPGIEEIQRGVHQAEEDYWASRRRHQEHGDKALQTISAQAAALAAKHKYQAASSLCLSLPAAYNDTPAFEASRRESEKFLRKAEEIYRDIETRALAASSQGRPEEAKSLFETVAGQFDVPEFSGRALTHIKDLDALIAEKQDKERLNREKREAEALRKALDETAADLLHYRFGKALDQLNRLVPNISTPAVRNQALELRLETEILFNLQQRIFQHTATAPAEKRLFLPNRGTLKRATTDELVFQLPVREGAGERTVRWVEFTPKDFFELCRTLDRSGAEHLATALLCLRASLTEEAESELRQIRDLPPTLKPLADRCRGALDGARRGRREIEARDAMKKVLAVRQEARLKRQEGKVEEEKKLLREFQLQVEAFEKKYGDTETWQKRNDPQFLKTLEAP
ncbi:MAG: FHA domain-containing serine/threonine-protein kinase [Planctomycetota bacterium]